MPGAFPGTKAAWPPPDVVRDGFDRPRFIRLRLDRFPRGAENFHIDVALGPALGGAATAYIAALVRESVQRLWKQPVPAPVGRSAQAGAGSLEVDRWVLGLFGQKELSDCSSSWLDRPENATVLFGGSEADWPQPGPWCHPRIARLQRDLTKQLASGLARARLMRGVTASYELASVYPSAGLVDAEPLVFDYLKGSSDRREAMRRLRAVEGVNDAAASLRRIEELRKDFRRSPSAARPQMLARLTGDFLRLRSDMKLAWLAFSGMHSLRLVVEEGELDSSLNNSTLQVFCREELVANTRGSVVGDSIVQADVRGIAEVTVQMRRRKLDPAAHFSRHFYDPIKRLLEQFGAQKVLVEGDALILSLLEYGGECAECLAGARGCCIATALVHLVDTMNAEHDRIGLPRVELGLGAAYAGEAPTYLYDHARKVTISPAIARARLLSNCHAELRRTFLLPGGRGLCVASSLRRDSADGQIGEELVRYNVNGIELDAAAYAQLNTEISLRRLSRRGEHPEIFVAGVCADVNGESHWLVVRERSVKLWLGGQLLEAEEEGRRYYEVISDSKLIGRVREKLSGEVLE